MAPYIFYLDVVVEQTSFALVEQHLPPLTEGEFKCYIRTWLIISSCFGWSKNDFWSSKEDHQKTNACHFNFKDKMNKKCFDNIMRELRLTNHDPPVYRNFSGKFVR